MKETEPYGFDIHMFRKSDVWPTELMTDELIAGDWTKGPAGTNQIDWTNGEGGRIDLETGELAESWETPDKETIIYHIRKGVHWWDKPPANGREYTAEDAAFNIKRDYAPGFYRYPSNHPVGQEPKSVTVLDKYTVEVKIPSEFFYTLLISIGDMDPTMSPDVIALYGNQNDWRHFVSTGPYMVTDYVNASSVTYVRNPNYWQKDPLHPENQLPYMDGVTQLIIPELSTVLAGLRTGKIDMNEGISYTDKDNIEKTHHLESVGTVLDNWTIWGRVDKPELPFKDIRVRQALNLAVNQQEIVDKYFGGHAFLICQPYAPVKGYEAFMPKLEEMPKEPTIPGSECTVPELFTYNPDKAKQLLAEAGYPNGFKTQVVCDKDRADYMSLIAEYFAEVGVDMELKVLDATVYTGFVRAKSHEQMVVASSGLRNPYELSFFKEGDRSNAAMIVDQRVETARAAANAAAGWDNAEYIRVLKDLGPYILEQAWGVWLPAEKIYVVWQPWLQNFYGCTYIGKSGGNEWTKYAWIDKALKKSLGY